ncbi:MAG TPA: thiamine-phosphate kinase [Candidatus Latescibacteria bacterium]|nr:thiamine-phosphate kinase [Candidatus Latescibacterota bacterium]
MANAFSPSETRGDTVNADGMTEADLLKTLFGTLPPCGADVIVGVGDDCAVLRADGDDVQVLTTDALIEGVDFVVGPGFSFENLGHKALAVNLSDIAAMGAIPRHALVTLCIPEHYGRKEMAELYQGFSRLASRHGVGVIGGDLSSSRNDFMVSVTLLGTASRSEILLRSGAKPGDAAMLFGRIGDSGAGLDITRGAHCPSEAILLERHFRPEPLVDQGRWLANRTGNHVHAMIDISDGLASDARHICEASGVGVRIDHASLPVSDELAEFARYTGRELDGYLLGAGEDYALFAAVDASAATEIAGRFRSAFPRTPVATVGSFRRGNHVEIRWENGAVSELAGGFDHFARQ